MPAPPYSPPTSYFWKTLNLFLQTTSCSQFGGHLGCHAAAFFLFSFSQSLFLGFPPPSLPLSLPPSRPTSLDNCHIRCVCRIYRDICHVTIHKGERRAQMRVPNIPWYMSCNYIGTGERRARECTKSHDTAQKKRWVQTCQTSIDAILCVFALENVITYIYMCVYKHIPPHMYIVYIYISLSLCARGYVVLNVNVWHSSVYIYMCVCVCVRACICGFTC